MEVGIEKRTREPLNLYSETAKSSRAGTDSYDEPLPKIALGTISTL